ncbi:MAG: hypothetical protein GTN76_15790 [Candidatus Aenigmarchaeota archaeon]|nr:hypothetical protein [Candidatus Aenigmarchaeota archaeon]
MKEKTFPPSEFKVTYIHSDQNKEFQKTWAWLDEVYKGGKGIPAIASISDPDANGFMVYDGNKRVRHASEREYDLRTLIMFNQADLDTYLASNTKKWFGITDFKELLEFMRIHLQYPHEDQELPPEIKAKIQSKEWEWKNKQRKVLWMEDD